MTKLQIPKNRINYLLKQLAKHIEPEELDQGWALYHKGHVASIHPQMDSLQIEAVVRDEELIEVTIDLEKFESSECSHHGTTICEHMAAVILALYAAHGRPELVLQELKALAAKKPRPVKTRMDQLHQKVEAPEEKGTSEAWQRFFDKKFYGFAISHSYTFDMFAIAVWDSLAPYASTWSKTMKQLYLLNIIIFTLRKIEDFYLTSKSSYLSSYHETSCKQAVSFCQDNLNKLFLTEQSADLHLSKTHERSWHNMLQLLGESALQGKDSPIDWLYVYRRVWTYLGDRKIWVEAEILRLEEEIMKQERLHAKLMQEHPGKAAASASKHDVLLLARAHFEVMNDNIDEAHKLLNKMYARTANDCYTYLEQYATNGKWELMLKWLRWIYPMMKTANQEDFRILCQYWTETAKHTNTDYEWVQTMEALLPRSYYYYTSHLLQSKRYRQWIDLQLATRMSPLNLYALELRAVEEFDPRLLLPLYHQTIERSILEKNRASYKIALKLLSKLAEYYRKLGMTLEWTLYMQELSDKFSRLRAFQDELKKGRWMS
jgi:hypothetical protein